MPTCKLTKKTLSHILRHAFCLHFLRIHHDYFFQRGFESVRAQFLSGNINGKQCYFRSSRLLQEVFYKKGVLRNFAKFTGKHPRQSLFFNKVIKKETVAMCFPVNKCKISKYTSFYRRPPAAVSVTCNLPVQLHFIQVNFIHAKYGI